MKKGLIAVCCAAAVVVAPVAIAASRIAPSAHDTAGTMAGTTVLQPTFLLPNSGSTTCLQLGWTCFTQFDGTYNSTAASGGLPTPMSYDGLVVAHGLFPATGSACISATMNLFLVKGTSNILVSAGLASGTQVCQTSPGNYSFTLNLTAVSGTGKFAGVTGTFNITGTGVSIKAKLPTVATTPPLTSTGSITF